VIRGDMSGGELGQFILYASIVAGAIAALSEVLGDAQRAAGATERLIELMDVQSPIQSPKIAIAISEKHVQAATLQLEDIVFHYPSRPNTNALSSISMDIKAGETVAIVGASGAGKPVYFNCCYVSTILSMAPST